MTESPLRDLARKLRQTARDHIAYSQVAELMNHVDSHLGALAYCEETNRRMAAAEPRHTEREAILCEPICTPAVCEAERSRYEKGQT